MSSVPGQLMLAILSAAVYSVGERNPHSVMKITCKSTFKRYMTLWHPMMTIAVAQCDAHNTKR
jgi:hypothetical protein